MAMAEWEDGGGGSISKQGKTQRSTSALKTAHYKQMTVIGFVSNGPSIATSS